VADGDDLYLWRVDKRKGMPVWKKLIAHGNYKNQQAKHVVALTRHGRQGHLRDDWNRRVEGFDFNGNELWMRDIQKDYGKFGLMWGYASSPLLYGDSL